MSPLTPPHPRMPAEWAEHEACLMVWPTRASLWGPAFEAAKREYAAVARAIADFEPVVMIAAHGLADEARAACAGDSDGKGDSAAGAAGHSIEVVELPVDDSWLRDSGPIFAYDAHGHRVGVDFRFNAWGEKHHPWTADDKLASLLLDRLGTPRVHSSMVLEGGALTVDGEGTLITTEQCLLHPNRNPRMSRTEIEDELKRRLGVEKVIWLPYGGLEDTEIDGHVDGVAAYVAPAKVVVSLPEDKTHPDYARMRANLAVLEASTDARGRALEIVALPQTTHGEVEGTPVEVGHLNFYLANGGCVVPVGGDPDSTSDAEALAVLAAALPGRKVVGVPTPVLAYGGGGIHCITQQLPKDLNA
ncbi:agmatine deiminase family protein [Streptomyces sp. NBC_01294]|uniref:agmatine deiminase family protein n=1 Tax=Streptomyces sp. NBC_01294 TaxID=2903815 RepID=UPI002DDAB383|nr:agmatine deiminase family protein [Streptomyces sp. NBC_01294]WRZ56200.1 agmatine deiminase family protein [Streptomyces sp. NBC_01294]